MADEKTYFSVSTIQIAPGKVDEALRASEEIAKATLENEPDAKIYRYWKVDGKDELVWVEKFTSREAYSNHVNSQHVQAWAKKYLPLGIFVGNFEFHPLDGMSFGGFDRE